MKYATCNTCKLDKPHSDFSKGTSPEGLQYKCREYCRINADRIRQRKAATYIANADVVAQKGRAYRLANEQEVKARKRDYYEKHARRIINKSRQYKLANPPSELENAKSRARSKRWRENNSEHWRAQWYVRLRRKRNATPSWADRAAILNTYKAARLLELATGRQYHVDHIVPLRGATVSGLHVEYNLQILPAIDNLRKSNLVWPDMP